MGGEAEFLARVIVFLSNVYFISVGPLTGNSNAKAMKEKFLFIVNS